MNKYVSAIYILLTLVAFVMPSVSFADDIFESAQERNIYEDVASGHYIKARRAAEELLEANPDSIGGNFALANVFWYGEGNHMRAMTLYKKTIQLFEKRYCKGGDSIPENSELQAWHQRIYKDLARIYAELDMRAEELNIHQLVANRYHAELGEDSVWALMKLNRFDEATAISEKSIKGQDSFWADIAYNDLTAIADAQHKHLEAMKASQRSVEFNNKSCVVLLNHSRGYSIFLKMDEAIQYTTKARSMSTKDCVNSPYTAASTFYLIDGKWQMAISSMLKARKRPVERKDKIQVEMSERRYMATILFEMGFAERAWALMETVMNAPSRLGYESLLKEQMKMAETLTYFAISSDALARTEEGLSAWRALEPMMMNSVFRKIHGIFRDDPNGIKDKITDLQENRDKLIPSLWSMNQKLFKYALNPLNLKSFLVPYYVVDPPLYNYAIVDTLGRRTAEFFVEYQKSILEPEEREAMMPAFDVLSAYIAWRDEDYDKALELVEKTHDEMPPKVSLMLRQVDLIKADILMKKGNRAEAMNLMNDVFKVYPAVFRHFDVKLPIRFDDSMRSDPELKNAMKALENSPRFEVASDAQLVVSGQKVDKMIQICLSSALGQRFACSSEDIKDYGGNAEIQPHTAEIVDSFHHKVFSPLVDLSQADLNSLDGSAVQMSADQALEKLINTTPLMNSKYDDENM
ncbi:MAG: hypothetical protein IJU23_03540 [Proteobacteria bacterium]|nr:hypothetical protein [Pseudomonadota bacterium]